MTSPEFSSTIRRELESKTEELTNLNKKHAAHLRKRTHPFSIICDSCEDYIYRGFVLGWRIGKLRELFETPKENNNS